MAKTSRYEVLQSIISSKQNSVTRPAQVTKTIYYGTVVDNNDPENRSRIKVYVDELDVLNKQNKDRLPWCYYFFAQNIQHIPMIGETVAIVLENPWEKLQGRWWVGPITDGRNISIPLDSVAISARKGNSVECLDNKDIRLTTDSENTERNRRTVTIYLNDEERKINIDADEILLASTNSGESGDEFSLPYGERLVELLDFMLEVLMTHTHPPNAPPHPNFFEKALSYKNQLESWLLNNKIKHKGNHES